MNRRLSDKYKAIFLGGIGFMALSKPLIPAPDNATDIVLALVGMAIAAALVADDTTTVPVPSSES